MTPNDVFERVIHLSDNGDESNGNYDIQDNREYKFRIIPIINMLQNELYPYSDTYKTGAAGKRPVLAPLTSFDDEIGLDDFCAGTVLPYGVGARLFTDENTSLASFYEQEYERLLQYLKSGGGMPAESEDIVDVYGGGYYDEFGNWHYYNGNGIGFEWVARWD